MMENNSASRSFLLILFFLVFSGFPAFTIPPHAFAGQATLAWDPNTQPELAGYKVYYGTSSRQYDNVNNPILVDKEQTSCTISDLTEGQTYYFAVKSYAADNDESIYSEEVSYTIPMVPVASFTLDPTSGKAPLLVDFDAAGSTDPDGSLVSYEWDFGDGTAATGIGVSHQYDIAGSYTVTLTVTDDSNNTATATDTVTVTQNTVPVANDSSVATQEDTSVGGVLSAEDADGDPLAYELVSSGSLGLATLTDSSTGTFSYTPAANASGTDTFTFRVNDGEADSNDATVTVSISPVNDAPVAQADEASTDEGTSVSIEVLSNDTDVDGDALSIQSVTAPSNGEATIDGSSILYTPAAGFSGQDSFAYDVSDGHGGTASAAVSVNVWNVNDPPVAVDDSASTEQETAVNIAVLENDSDQDGDSLTVDWVEQPLNGDVENRGTDVVYTPASGFSGTESFAYSVADGHGGTASAMITVNVSAANETSGSPLMAFDEIQLDYQWTYCALPAGFSDPVVVAGPLSINGGDPGVVRIRNVSSAGFEIRLQEYEYLDGWHTTETVSYLAMESGRHELSDGTIVEAGSFMTNATGSSFDAFWFTEPLPQPPVVMTSVSSDIDSTAVAGRIRNITADGFEYQMQEQENSDQTHQDEVIAYIAWEPSSGVADGVLFEVGTTGDVVRDGFHTLTFNTSFQSAPVFLAGQQTRDGGDTANVRFRDKTASQVSFQVDEEQSNDSETGHTTEEIGYLCLTQVDVSGDADNDGLLGTDEMEIYQTDPFAADTDGDGLDDGAEVDYWGTSWDLDIDGDGLVNLLDSDSDGDGFTDGTEVLNGFDPSDPSDRPQGPIMEFGSLEIDQTWTSVQFQKQYANPVVIAGPLGLNEDDPAVVRIRNVTPSGFEMRVQEWDYLDGAHAPESASYLVVDKGRYTLDDGSVVEAELFDTSSTSFGNVAFDGAFIVSPVVVSSVTTSNEADAVVGRIRNVSATGFDYRLQEQEASSESHAEETVSYIAWEPSVGAAGNVLFEVGMTANEVTDGFSPIAFNQAFSSPVHFVAAMQTQDGGDTANVRMDHKNELGVEVQIDEEQSNDSEVAHTTEVVGFMAFSQDSASQTVTAVFGDTPDGDYPGTVQDTFININEEVNAAHEQLNTYTWPENMVANAVLLKFDLSQLPAGAQIQSAFLKLYQTAVGGDASYDVSAHKVVNHNPYFSQANGYTYDGANYWTPNDACYNSIPLAQADIAPAEDVNSLDQSLGYKEWDVTLMVQEWFNDPSTNYGLLLNSDAVASSDSHRYFAATEATDSATRPKLEVVYSY